MCGVSSGRRILTCSERKCYNLQSGGKHMTSLLGKKKIPQTLMNLIDVYELNL